MATVFCRIAGAGFRFENCVEVKEYMDRGDHPAVRLEREPTNTFDKNAVRIVATIDGRDLHLGYIPRENSARASIALDEKRIKSVSIVRLGYKAGGSRSAYGQVKIEVDHPTETSAPGYYIPPTKRLGVSDETIAEEEGATLKNPDGVRTDDPFPSDPEAADFKVDPSAAPNSPPSDPPKPKKRKR